MNILHVVATRPRGGIGTFLKNLVKTSTKTKSDFLIGSRVKEDEFDLSVKAHNSEVHVLTHISSPIKYIFQLYDFFKINRHVHKYDLIHVHSPIVFFAVYFFNRLYWKIPIACHSHSTKLSDSLLGSIRNFILYTPVKYFSDLNISCSLSAGEFLYGTRPFVVVPNGINTNEYRFDTRTRNIIRKELALADKIVIGQIGAFFKVKNHSFSLEILRFIRSHDPQFYDQLALVFVGDGPEENNIRHKVTSFGLESKVTFLGRREDLSDLYNALDLYIMPSIFEGVPLSGIEAQTNGLPCIFSTGVSRDVEYKNCKFISLEGVKLWSEELIKTGGFLELDSRSFSSDDVKGKGGDFSDSVYILENAYNDMK